MPGGTKHLFFSIHPKNIRVMIFTKDMEFTDVWTMTQELCKTYTEVTHYLFEQNTLLNRGGLI